MELMTFIICAGYKGYIIKEYFANYFLHGVEWYSFDMKHNSMEVHKKRLILQRIVGFQ